MTPSRWFLVAAGAAGVGAAAMTVWASIDEQDAPGWRSNLGVVFAAVCSAMIGCALLAPAGPSGG